MTGHFTSYETRTNHELATLGVLGVDIQPGHGHLGRKGLTAIAP
jgi:hypothetical protein